MNIQTVFEEIKEYYQKSNKFAFWLTLLVLNQTVGFTPHMPAFALYFLFLAFAVYQLIGKEKKVDIYLLSFLIYIPLQLLITTPDAAFKSWERFVLFVLLIICVSPLLVSEKSIKCRRTMFLTAMYFCTFIGIGSFFGRFLGLNYMYRYDMNIVFSSGFFGGLTVHSMLLGPIAGIGTIFMVYSAYKSEKKIYWLMAFICLLSVFFSASRSALGATIAGCTLALFRLSGAVGRFAKSCIIISLLGSLSFPLWGGALDAVKEKNNLNVQSGSALSSRESLWNYRFQEFREHPILGMGFAAVKQQGSAWTGFNKDTGIVESGSSWLIILSMTGIIGTYLLFAFFIRAYFTAYRDKEQLSALVCGVLTLFYVHMVAEGYIFFGGSQMAFMLWLTVGVAMDCKYLIEE